MPTGFIHYGLHFGLPLIVALLFYDQKWKIIYLIFMVTMLIDLDHLLATPVFDPCRCSINFHPLHNYLAAIVYAILALYKRTRVVGIGLLMHILADSIDCIMQSMTCTGN